MAVVDISNGVIKRYKGQLVRWHMGFALRCMNENENVGVVEFVCVTGLALLSTANKEDLYQPVWRVNSSQAEEGHPC